MASKIAHTLEEALFFLQAEALTPHAGGTDIMVKEGADLRDDYLFLNNIASLKCIYQDDHYLHIGAGCTFSDVNQHPLIPDLLKQAMAELAAPAIRNRGTIGGNIGNGSAKADSVLIFFVYDAMICLQSSRGIRTLPIEAFYLNNKQLDLRADELIVDVMIPRQNVVTHYYKKIGARKALAISRVAFTGIIDIEDDIIKHFAVAFGAIESKVVRRKELDKTMIGLSIKEAKVQAKVLIETYEKTLAPISGRISADYRKSVCLNLLKDFLKTHLDEL